MKQYYNLTLTQEDIIKHNDYCNNINYLMDMWDKHTEPLVRGTINLMMKENLDNLIELEKHFEDNLK